MAESVNEELTHDGYPGAKEFADCLAEKKCSLAPGDQTAEIHGTLLKGVAGLDRGELDTIRLYKKGYGDFVITDDGRGAGYCKRHKIPFINALLFPRVLRGQFSYAHPRYWRGISCRFLPHSDG